MVIFLIILAYLGFRIIVCILLIWNQFTLKIALLNHSVCCLKDSCVFIADNGMFFWVIFFLDFFGKGLFLWCLSVMD